MESSRTLLTSLEINFKICNLIEGLLLFWLKFIATEMNSLQEVFLWLCHPLVFF